jgi:hypothetical protein
VGDGSGRTLEDGADEDLLPYSPSASPCGTTGHIQGDLLPNGGGQVASIQTQVELTEPSIPLSPPSAAPRPTVLATPTEAHAASTSLQLPALSLMDTNNLVGLEFDLADSSAARIDHLKHVASSAAQAQNHLESTIFEIAVAEYLLEVELRQKNYNNSPGRGGTGRRSVSAIFADFVKEWPTLSCPLPLYLEQDQFERLMATTVGLPGKVEAAGEHERRFKAIERAAASAKKIYNEASKLHLKESETFFSFFCRLQQCDEGKVVDADTTAGEDELKEINNAVADMAKMLVEQLRASNSGNIHKDLQELKAALAMGRGNRPTTMDNPRAEDLSQRARNFDHVKTCPDVVFISILRWMADLGKVPITNLNVVIRLCYTALYGELPPADFFPGVATIRRYMHALADVDDELR